MLKRLLFLTSLLKLSNSYKIISGIFQSNIFYSIDNKINEQDRICIDNAVEEINRYYNYTNKKVYIFNDCYFCDNIKYHTIDSVGFAIIKAYYTTNNWKKSSCNIYIKQGLDPNICNNVMLHEFLHCLGLDHSDDKTSVMGYHVTDDNSKLVLNEDDVTGLLNLS